MLRASFGLPPRCGCCYPPTPPFAPGRGAVPRPGAGWRYLFALLELGYHDDEGRLLLPHHLPEVGHGVRHGSLGGDVLPGVPRVALPSTGAVRDEGPWGARGSQPCQWCWNSSTGQRLSYVGYFLLNLPLKSFHGPDQELPGIPSILQTWQQATCTRPRSFQASPGFGVTAPSVTDPWRGRARSVRGT